MAKSPTNRMRVRRGGLVAGVAATGLALLMGGLAVPAAAADTVDCSTVPWMDASASSDARAAALLAASNQHQKYRWLVEQPAVSPTRTDWQPGRAGENPVVYPVQVAVHADHRLHRWAGGGACGAASPTSRRRSRSPPRGTRDLALEKGAAQAEESFAKGRNVILAPGIASGRTPLAGRTPEYFGEDPLLSGLLGAADGRGHRVDRQAVVANLKHYVANEQELDRQTSSSNMDERTMREIYGLPYEIALNAATPRASCARSTRSTASTPARARS